MNVEEQLAQLQAQLISAQAEIQRLREQNDEMCDRIRAQSQIINRAKDINPVARPSFRRVLTLARAAFLDLCKCPGGGWFLSLGHRVRKFKTLRQIWDILCLYQVRLYRTCIIWRSLFCLKWLLSGVFFRALLNGNSRWL
jgi:hypothetical protein